ncbi:alpha/beta fold hydrolase [Sphingobium boeckii]|uniref:Pimeloyl-ACP methyl ester carboxylesterase n=1 Tax=Sphingobium boeckii TaxID=1082345 RepID=A0A7W9AHY4_9SPHN|nr:alpha/beta hydrolase [Sphingobium boeckii]MBB5685741.1 pimeloyl-ACP methyl ester carboxylesterase [Sphingobium boeckii]
MNFQNNNRNFLEYSNLHGRLVTSESEPISLIVCVHGGGCNGRYFDLPSFSFVNEAVATGHAVLIVDRPGHGVSPAIDAAAPIRSAAALLSGLAKRAGKALGNADLPVSVFGHSIGGAVAMHWAAEPHSTLKCVVTSGIGARPSITAMAWHGCLNAENDIVLPRAFFFGPDGSFDWRAPIALRRSAEPWRRQDVDEVLLQWPEQYSSVAARISCPTLSILSEHERIWETDDATLEFMRGSLANVHSIVEIAAGGGHLHEVHRNWSVHAKRVINFIEGHI